MSLSAAEKLELETLEAMETPQLVAAAPPAQGGLTAQEAQELKEIEAFEAQEQEAQRVQGVFHEASKNPEASLGFGTRAQFAIEPIQSNRIGLLQRKFGAENVFQNPDTGDLFLEQGGELRPLNAPGFSVADVADFTGTLPEIAGTIGVGAAGALAGSGVAPGPGTIAGAVGGGAAGAAAGSAIRQGLSAFLGTPQIATVEERGEEVLFSGVLGGLTGGAGHALKGTVKGAVRGVAKKIAPLARTIKRSERISALAKRFKVDAPTLGQKLGKGSKVGDQEKLLAETPFFGRKARRVFNRQSDQIMDAVKREIGDFADDSLDMAQSGKGIKRAINTKVGQVKALSQKMFDEVKEIGSKVTLDGDQASKDLLKTTKGLRMFDQSGRPLSHSAKSGLDKETFEEVQRVIRTASESMKGGQLDMNQFDAVRRTISQEANAAFSKNPNAFRFLKSLENEYLDIVDRGLAAKHPAAGEVFKGARALWAKFRQEQELLEKLGLNDLTRKGALNPRALADEKVVSRIFSDSTKVRAFNQLMGPKAIKKTADKWVKSQLGDRATEDGVLSLAKARTFFNKNKSVLSRVYGEKKVTQLRELLEFGAEIQTPVNPSKTAITQGLGSVPEIVGRGMTLKTTLGVLNGTVELPERVLKAATAGAVLKGQESKRRAVFQGRKQRFDEQRSLGKTGGGKRRPAFEDGGR